MLYRDQDLVTVFEIGSRRPIDIVMSDIIRQNVHNNDNIIEMLDRRLDANLQYECCQRIDDYRKDFYPEFNELFGFWNDQNL